MRSPIDLALLVLLAVAFPIVESVVLWPRSRRRLASGAPGARVRVYGQTFAIHWGLSALVAAAWVLQRHSWSALRVAPPGGWRLLVGAGVCAAMALVMGGQVAALARSPRAGALRARFGSVEPILPHTRGELGVFVGLSVSAGLCEEWLFRGAVTVLFAAWMPLALAVLLCNVAFGFCHAYQGRGGIVKTGAVGLVMSGFVLLTGSLLPAMLLHAIVDVGGGWTGYVAITRPDPAPAAPVAPAA